MSFKVRRWRDRYVVTVWINGVKVGVGIATHEASARFRAQKMAASYVLGVSA